MLELLVALPILVKAALLGIIEGLTEFLPISSTGHLILASSVLGFEGEKAKMFTVSIQTGAMLAVIWYYRARITDTFGGMLFDARARRFALNVVVAFVPAAALGLLFAESIKERLFHPVPVAIAFVVGGLLILWVERGRHRPALIDDVDAMTLRDAVKVGIAQAFALIPGTSRSGATIVGGMLFGLSRAAATEFSFFLAIPTLIGAGVYDAWKYRALLGPGDAPMFAVGLLFSFFAALACVRWLIRYVARNDFVPFAWYRIAFGIVVLVTAWSGLVQWNL
ncbi:MAG TPA: undecaprenyl-diphosphate phosphatase [Zeimonas sp.]|nr:undecaprenyl-diphosphate phosphatase [Zeimonas sp.]